MTLITVRIIDYSAIPFFLIRGLLGLPELRDMLVHLLKNPYKYKSTEQHMFLAAL